MRPYVLNSKLPMPWWSQLEHRIENKQILIMSKWYMGLRIKSKGNYLRNQVVSRRYLFSLEESVKSLITEVATFLF